ncbi:MAG: class I SAM-dependent methyltransferase [Candidatus Omnitrophica bacterium]|nr:class I SAM-dependent methyltransferase [Candidatus Omnitrophota bacterium]
MGDNIYSRKEWVERFVHPSPADSFDEERLRNIVGAIPEDARAILDVGLGGGFIFGELKRKNGVRCFGIDLSPELVGRLKDPRVCVADAKNIPFKDRQFDLVLAADILEHLKDEYFDESVSELKRVSRKYILINSPFKDAIDWPVALCNKCNREFNVYGHIRAVNEKLINRLFPKAEFDIVNMKVFGKRRDARPSAVVRAARKLGKVYSAEGALCPYCFNDSIERPSRNAIEACFGKVSAAIFFLMDRLTPSILKQGSEISVLLRKRL